MCVALINGFKLFFFSGRFTDQAATASGGRLGPEVAAATAWGGASSALKAFEPELIRSREVALERGGALIATTPQVAPLSEHVQLISQLPTAMRCPMPPCKPHKDLLSQVERKEQRCARLQLISSNPLLLEYFEMSQMLLKGFAA